MNHELKMAALAATMILGAAALTGCSSDDSEPTAGQPADTDALQLLTYTRAMTDMTPTRAWSEGVSVPTGFINYTDLYPKPHPSYCTIGMFLTPEDAGQVGAFTYLGPDSDYIGDDADTPYEWGSEIYVQEKMLYYAYGFMPIEMAQKATIEPLTLAATDDKGYAAGAIITLDDIELVAPSDPCVVVGVQDVDTLYKEGMITPLAQSTARTGNKGVEMGAFSYMGKKKRRNFVRLLLDHVYAGVQFNMTVDPTYSELRTIRLRQLTLTSSLGQTIDCKITLKANDTGADPIRDGGDIAFSDLKTGTSSAVVFDDDVVIPVKGNTEGTQLDILGCFTPSIEGIGSSLSITTTYDVYDKAGNPVREGATATNKLPTIPVLERGQKYILYLNVNPTYLYQLSDPDLDNPTIKITL